MIDKINNKLRQFFKKEIIFKSPNFSFVTAIFYIVLLIIILLATKASLNSNGVQFLLILFILQAIYIVFETILKQNDRFKEFLNIAFYILLIGLIVFIVDIFQTNAGYNIFESPKENIYINKFDIEEDTKLNINTADSKNRIQIADIGIQFKANSQFSDVEIKPNIKDSEIFFDNKFTKANLIRSFGNYKSELSIYGGGENISKVTINSDDSDNSLMFNFHVKKLTLNNKNGTNTIEGQSPELVILNIQNSKLDEHLNMIQVSNYELKAKNSTINSTYTFTEEQKTMNLTYALNNSTVILSIPKNIGSNIKFNSDSKFTFFGKIEEEVSGEYRSSNFESSEQKIYIEIDSINSNFEIKGY